MLLQLGKHKEKSRMHRCDSPTPVSTIGAGSSGTSATFALQIGRASKLQLLIAILFFDKPTSIPLSSLVKLHNQPHPNKAQSWAQPRWHLGFEAQEFFVLKSLDPFVRHHDVDDMDPLKFGVRSHTRTPKQRLLYGG